MQQYFITIPKKTNGHAIDINVKEILRERNTILSPLLTALFN